MTNKATWIILLSAFLASLGRAHHSVVSVYDMETTVDIVGVVTAFRLVNPHGTLSIDVETESGEIEEWRVELPGTLALERRGWTNETIPVGVMLTVNGSPSRRGRPELFWRKITFEDGTELLEPFDEDAIELEEQRRQRIIEAQSQQQ